MFFLEIQECILIFNISAVALKKTLNNQVVFGSAAMVYRIMLIQSEFQQSHG